MHSMVDHFHNGIFSSLYFPYRRVAVVSQYDRKNGGSAGSRPGLNRRRTTTSLTEDEVVKPERPPGPTVSVTIGGRKYM